MEGEILWGEAIADAGAEEFGECEEAEYPVLAVRVVRWNGEEEQEGEEGWSHYYRRSMWP